MDNFVSTFIFILPGFLCYYGIKAFGIEPTQKHDGFEMAALAAVLWAPVTALSLAVYNLIVWIAGKMHFSFGYITNLNDLQNHFNSFRFLAFYLLLSFAGSIIIAWLFTGKLYQKALKMINTIRRKRHLSEFSNFTTVWAEFIIPYGVKVVEISKISDPGKKTIGCIRKGSRPMETERNLFLDDIDYFTKLVEEHDISVINAFVDLRSDIIIKLFDPKEIKKAQM